MSNQQIAIRQTFETLARPEFQSRLRESLPDNISAAKFTSITKTAIQQNPNVLDGDRASLFNAIVRCAQDGLRPDGKEAALVVMGGKVSYMPMIGGLRRIAAKYGVRIATGVVHANDLFEYELGVTPVKRHLPPKLGEDRGPEIGAWAEAQDKDGNLYLEVMTRDEIEKVRAVSRAGKSGPWVAQWGEMARKTVGRRLFKSLPLYDMDERDSRAIEAADSEFEFNAPAEEPAPKTAAPTRPSVLATVAATVVEDEPEPYRQQDDPGF
jgi:recombination protein RecT